MTNNELVSECKKGLNIPEGTDAFDNVLLQKVTAVKNYLENAGVSETQLNTDAGTGVIVMGVADIWDIQGGEAKFSPAFNLMATQLAYKSLE